MSLVDLMKALEAARKVAQKLEGRRADLRMLEQVVTRCGKRLVVLSVVDGKKSPAGGV